MAQTKTFRRTRNLVREAKEALEATKDRVEEAKDKTEEVIKKNPFTSIAVAAAVGALVALSVNALFRQEKKSWRDRVREYF